ncbi:ATP-binding protein [Streptantibioticus ferralitis]|uniref:ATP-binding protein n=2 Tax=Streptantibioticus ferralitis TaxID=236510 RepID=A0ABT5Z0L1_9ACTN|nr:ATP-binding protein [Streptantibioticus ferralitis]
MPEVMQKYFEPKLESVSRAREFTTATLMAWGLDMDADDIRLCVSELATNALVHGTEPGIGFLVRLTVEDNDFVLLEVHDSRHDGHRPQVRHSKPSDASGRGLLIVEELADEWGVCDRQPSGKIVWLRFKAVAAVREAAC